MTAHQTVADHQNVCGMSSYTARDRISFWVLKPNLKEYSVYNHSQQNTHPMECLRMIMKFTIHLYKGNLSEPRINPTFPHVGTVFSLNAF